MRAVSAGAVTLKSTSETLRKSLGLDKEDDIGDELPELVISVMTKQEKDIVTSKAGMRSIELDEGIVDSLPDAGNNIVVGDCEPSEVST